MQKRGRWVSKGIEYQFKSKGEGRGGEGKEGEERRNKRKEKGHIKEMVTIDLDHIRAGL